ncbi:MAG: DNA-protecting protein DprA [Gemmobacter sp.]|uniref:DNA-processing protein DprA n=1 Tax=Gemmobacter sp. TaxID=1898957 RepID=UPI001A4E1916|nr:DNA-processing protein DprA [Gemmobacter sp.]MBL8563759.1 DNA-protecting protein DprA [Gemmobacter sp.]
MVAGLDTPHPTPHTTEQDRLCRLRLIRSRRVGPATYHRLVAEHGSAQAALEALPEIARAGGIEGYEPCPEAVALAEMRAARAVGARMLCAGDRHYPDALRQIADAPPILWLRGRPELLLSPMVGVVGARNASSLGLRMARRLAAALGEAGFTVVSGLARGIDAEAHVASLATGTVAVVAGGVDRVYPAENGPLMARMAETGCLVSEQPPGLEPQARHFPLRNRIISGLSRALVVVEAAARSGSLLTAREAAEQGREVFAVPGHPFDARAAGCNLLIREGATLVRAASDVLEALGMQGVRAEGPLAVPDLPGQDLPEPGLPGPVPPRRPLRDLAALHRLILDRLAPSPLAEDQLIRDLALPSDDVTPELLALEMEGALVRQPGGLLARA